jgi:hypothetical protein
MPSRSGFLQFGNGAHCLALRRICADKDVFDIEGEIRAFDRDDAAHGFAAIAHGQRAWRIRLWDSGAHVQAASAVVAAS